ncbi:2TM domain-containing protein [Flavobacterium crassostreae]|uniref:2TM domain-containing protein n=1 Tax=Flavobacterium crassostreae TaxID=1763534 RepID=A0A1B9DZQ6_9FLAO|nr:2TM domain-containing protein [Flavobacterium crassostreae]OCB75182.1 hypothetical protein LPBF_08975 [Flavobacterium crassostreae]
MEREQHELYEYARKRIKQKKGLYYHFVLLFLVCIFLFVATKVMDFTAGSNLHMWLITIWFFLFILHFIKVFITDRFMNKNWEREQIDRLVALQQKKLTELENHLQEPTK